MKPTMHATPEQISDCWMLAKKNSNMHISNDAAREYVAAHTALQVAIARAQAQMLVARYEFELSNLLDEDGCDDSPHFDKSFKRAMRGAKLRDEAVRILEAANDIDRETYEWLRFTYLYDLATV
jgi:hypothetical protein